MCRKNLQKIVHLFALPHILYFLLKQPAYILKKYKNLHAEMCYAILYRVFRTLLLLFGVFGVLITK